MIKVVLLLFLLTVNNELSFSQGRLSPAEAREKFSLVLHQQGVNSAIQFIDNYLNYSQDYHTLYSIGWAEFLKGNFEDAEQIAFHLYQEPLGKNLAAAVAFLMGNIYTHDGISTTDPLPLLHQALDSYKGQKMVKGVFRSNLALGTAHLSLGDLEKAKSYLILAFQLAIKYKLDLALYHNLAYMVYYAEGFHLAAKKHLASALKIHEEREHIVAIRETELNLATICLFLGQTEEAYVYNSQTIDFFRDQKDSLRHKIGLINHYFINGCEIDDFEKSPESIIEYAQSEDAPPSIRKIFSDLQFICR
jgi:tetratricopeptide (TPR) repeat protein